jgi:hypothetical protein
VIFVDSNPFGENGEIAWEWVPNVEGKRENHFRNPTYGKDGKTTIEQQTRPDSLKEEPLNETHLIRKRCANDDAKMGAEPCEKDLESCDIFQAQYVKIGKGKIERIASKYGITPEGLFEDYSSGNFGVVTESGTTVSVWDNKLYYKDRDVRKDID